MDLPSIQEVMNRFWAQRQVGLEEEARSNAGSLVIDLDTKPVALRVTVVHKGKPHTRSIRFSDDFDHTFIGDKIGQLIRDQFFVIGIEEEIKNDRAAGRIAQEVGHGDVRHLSEDGQE